MHVIFANPAGFWALLGLPAVLAIHYFQRQSRRVETSTFFLLESLAPVSAHGQRFDRLRSSLPLWLQLAGVLLLTWLLVQPLTLRRDSFQRIVVVLDSTVSLRAFRPELTRALSSRLRALDRAAARTDWRLLESDPTRPTLYAGARLADLLAAAGRWNPQAGTHDVQPALAAARSLVRDAGLVLFVSDRRAELPEGVELLAVGHPIENCGWIGMSVEGDTWRALVRNHGTTPQTRTWHLEAAGAVGSENTLTLAAGQTVTLKGSFPPGQDRVQLVLSTDAFPLDDRLPIVRPSAKRLTLALEENPAMANFLRRVADSIPDADVVTGAADVRLMPATDNPPKGHSVLFAPPGPETPDYLGGELVAEADPLLTGLSWRGLLCKDTPTLPVRPGDEGLLWRGERPLLFLRGGPADRSLYVNFDLHQSNADRLPAFIVLLGRYLESVRARKVAFERLNVETNQLLSVVGDPDLPAPALASGVTPLRASPEPSFFDVTQAGRPLLSAAAHFADDRAADFRPAATVDTLKDPTRLLAERHSRQDVLWPAVALLLAGVCLANWALTGGGR